MPSFDRDITYSDEAFFRIEKKHPLPPRARTRLLNVRGLAASHEAVSDAFWNQDQALMKELLDKKHQRDRSQDADAREFLTLEIKAFETRRADNKKARDVSGAIDSNFTDAVTRDVVALLRSGKPLKDYEPDLPEQTPNVDVKMVTETRAKITGKRKEIRDNETAMGSPADIMQRFEREINKYAAAGTPDIAAFIREEREDSGAYSPMGPIRWPRQFITGTTFASDGFSFVFWLFRDEVRKRLEAEVAKATAGRRQVPLAQRPALIKKLEAEILTLERVESALVWRLHDAGRTDIKHRRDVNFKAFLGLRTGTVAK